jgi:hypothetical protein
MIDVILDINENKWNKFIEETGSQGTLFQSTYWANYLKKTYKINPIYLVSYDKNARVNGQLLAFESSYANFTSHNMTGKKGIVFKSLYRYAIQPLLNLSLTSISWENGPLILPISTNENPNESISLYQNFLEKILQIANQKRCYEIKFARPPFFDDQPNLFDSFGFDKLKMGTFLVDVRRPYEEILQSVDRQVRRNLKHATDQGVTVNRVNNLKELEELYELHIQTSVRNNIKIYPFSFFESLWRCLSPKHKIEIFIARKEAQPLAGSICLMHNHIFHAFSLYQSDYARENRIYSNEMMWCEAIKWGHDNDYHFFDLSGVELGAIELGDEKAQGIYQFKNKFRGQLVESHDYQKPLNEKKIIKYLQEYFKDSNLHN